jgi:glutamate synthase (NADPH/NADH) large chain
MSFGSISKEAHETIAIGHEPPRRTLQLGRRRRRPRFVPGENGDLRRGIKQVASGRFGVTSEYLLNASELQIKMAQGAKPGEGGQLPGHKVDAVIARTRYSTEGVGLISPPPHHDIYSIEDLAQLITTCATPTARKDLREARERARRGHRGRGRGQGRGGRDPRQRRFGRHGRGAAVLHQARGVPWELGIAEAQQVLVMNGLRGRVHVRSGRPAARPAATWSWPRCSAPSSSASAPRPSWPRAAC